MYSSREDTSGCTRGGLSWPDLVNGRSQPGLVYAPEEIPQDSISKLRKLAVDEVGYDLGVILPPPSTAAGSIRDVSPSSLCIAFFPYRLDEHERE